MEMFEEKTEEEEPTKEWQRRKERAVYWKQAKAGGSLTIADAKQIASKLYTENSPGFASQALVGILARKLQ